MTGQADGPNDLVDVRQASEVLGVGEEQVHTMAEQGLLTPEGTGDAMRFRRAEVEAVREVGG